MTIFYRKILRLQPRRIQCKSKISWPENTYFLANALTIPLDYSSSESRLW